MTLHFPPRFADTIPTLPGAYNTTKALPPEAEGAEPCLLVTWDELAVVLKKAKKGQYGCWELYADGNTPSKASTANAVLARRESP